MANIKELIEFLDWTIKEKDVCVHEAQVAKLTQIKEILEQQEFMIRKPIIIKHPFGNATLEQPQPDKELVECIIETTAWNICSFLVASPSHTVKQLNHVKAEIRLLLQGRQVKISKKKMARLKSIGVEVIAEDKS